MSEGFDFKINKEELEFKINTKIYSLKAIYQTAYLFLDKVYLLLDGDPKKEVIVVMKLKPEIKQDLKILAGEFHNELFNQLLREKILETNAKIREYIVSKALYNAVPSEVDELLKEVEEEDWQEDPLGIAKPWEETKKKSSAKGGSASGGKTAKKRKNGKTKAK
jgi:His-Xaa-Ser system protein HxsD